MRSGDPSFWSNNVGSHAYDSWAWLAFERVCLQHIQQMKNALGIGSVATSQASWRTDRKLQNKNEKGAQIDLLLDRKDGTINICEMKWSADPFLINKQEWDDINNKVIAFTRECHPSKTIHITMVTTYGVKKNMYSDEIQSEVTADEFFI